MPSICLVLGHSHQYAASTTGPRGQPKGGRVTTVTRLQPSEILSVAELVGWTATATLAAMGLPQLVRIARTRDVEGLSLVAWQAMLVSNVSWAAHGLHIGQMPQVAANVLSLATTVPIL